MLCFFTVRAKASGGVTIKIKTEEFISCAI